MATPENKINPAEIQQMLKDVDIRFINLLLSSLGMTPAVPVLLSDGRSINLTQACLYEPLERMDVTSEFITLLGSCTSEIDKQLNDAKRSEADEIHVISELRFTGTQKDGIWTEQIQRITSTPSGEFDWAITLPSGEQVILSREPGTDGAPSENDMFRYYWKITAAVAEEYMILASGLFNVEMASGDIPENGDAGHTIVGEGEESLNVLLG